MKKEQFVSAFKQVILHITIFLSVASSYSFTASRTEMFEAYVIFGISTAAMLFLGFKVKDNLKEVSKLLVYPFISIIFGLGILQFESIPILYHLSACCITLIISYILLNKNISKITYLIIILITNLIFGISMNEEGYKKGYKEGRTRFGESIQTQIESKFGKLENCKNDNYKSILLYSEHNHDKGDLAIYLKFIVQDGFYFCKKIKGIIQI